MTSTTVSTMHHSIAHRGHYSTFAGLVLHQDGGLQQPANVAIIAMIAAVNYPASQAVTEVLSNVMRELGTPV